MILWAVIVGVIIVVSILRAHLNYVREKGTLTESSTGPAEKAGRIYFLANDNVPGRIQIVKSRGELATPLKVVREMVTPTPNAVLAQIYRELQGSHVSGTWYDEDAVLMYLDHLRGIA
jgi:hypothetical protein